MENYREGQYDDDLTVGIDEYNDNFDAGAVDLFEYVGDEDSPLSRLKSIILSIDWEITDDILRQFNEELQDLKDIWAGNKVNLIYVQALEKLSRYIYKEKANAHHNAIKLLLNFYSNLERIVSSDSLSDAEKKSILLTDVEKFEKLKKQIAGIPVTESVAKPAVEPERVEEDYEILGDDESEAGDLPEADLEVGPVAAISAYEPAPFDPKNPLINLKAIVYGIDWEITEQDLTNLSKEVKRLEKEFASSKARCIFLQGIGSLGAYINLKRSDAHADAFTLLHSFFVGLETVVKHDLSGRQEKEILLPQVEKFNAFKSSIAETISPEAIARTSSRQEDDSFDDEVDEGTIEPAFSDMPDDVHGFQEEKEIEHLKEHEDVLVEKMLDDTADEGEAEGKGESILASEMESRLDGMFADLEVDQAEMTTLDADVALQGVDVESDADDDSEEEPLPVEGGELAPALVEEGDLTPIVDSPAVFADQVEDFFGESEIDSSELVGQTIPGVDVETDADDDSDEEPLPFEEGEFAPALSTALEDEEISAEDDADDPAQEDEAEDDIDDHVTSFFMDEETSGPSETEDDFVDEESTDDDIDHEEDDVSDRIEDFFSDDQAPSFGHADEALDGVHVETDADDDSDEEPLPVEDGEFVPALSFGDDEEESESEAFVQEDDEAELFEGEEIEPSDNGDVESSLRFDTLDEDVDFAEDLALDGSPASLPDEQMESTESDDTSPALSSPDDEITEFDDDFSLEDEEGTVWDEEEAAEPESALGFMDSMDEDGDSTVPPVDDIAGTETFKFEDEEEETEDFFSEDVGIEAGKLQGVDVETDDDDDSDEEPLPLEDGELAPALADDGTEDDMSFAESDDEAESIVADRFDAFFTEEDQEVPAAPGVADIDGVDTSSVEEELLVGDDDLDDEVEDLATIWDGRDSVEISRDDEDSEEEYEDLAPALSLDEDDFGEEDDLAGFLGEEDRTLLESPTESMEEISEEDINLFLEEAETEIADESPYITHPEDNEDYIVGIVEEDLEQEQAEDEVVFEAFSEESVVGDQPEAEDEEEPAELDQFDSAFDDFDGYGTMVITEDKKEKEQHLVEEPADETVGSVDLEEPEEEVEPAYVPGIEGAPRPDNLSELRNCIVSLGLEINDEILASLNDEIEKLRVTWMERPLEKTFVQLLSTVSQHIERYRYEADPEANRLLLSIFDKLEVCSEEGTEINTIQEAILSETSKVLQWQQRIADRRSVQTEAVPPLTLDESENFDMQDLSGEELTFDKLESFEEEQEKGDIVSAIDDLADKMGDDFDKDAFMDRVAVVMRSELSQLKDAFQNELKELREEIRREQFKE